MSVSKTKDWSRDPARSREAILDAAESLFARYGYEQTSLQQVGQEAGVSRGTPGYFFGSKEQLYGEVLDRLFEAEYQSIESVLSQPAQPDEAPAERLALVISIFYDFLIARPTFVQLVEREAVNQGRFLQGRSTYLKLMQESLAMLGPALVNPAFRPLDPFQLMISIVALCWFPLAHTATFLKPADVDTDDPAFWQNRKQHVVDLVLRGILV